MHGTDLVDLNITPQERKALQRRRILRVGVPVVCMALLIGAILGITIFSYESNRRGASVLSDDLLISLETRISTEVASYLAPAPKMAQFARQTLAAGSFSAEGIAMAEKFGRNVLQTYEQIASFYVADGYGQFLMIMRGADGGTDTKLITIAPDKTRQVRLIKRDAVGQVLDESTQQDEFDPRTRPWYRGAVETRNLYWTDVYIFFTQRAPGVTAALPLYSDAGGVAAVYGMDITLSALSHFLKGIEIGKTGRAMIVDADGRLVAFPDAASILRDDNGTLVTRRLDELGDVALTRAFNRIRIGGHGHGTVDIDGERVIFASTALPIAAGKDWSVLIVVPEREVIGFVSSSNRTALLLSLSIIAVALVLAALLVSQGIRADRNARRVRDRQDALETQSRAFATIAESAALFDPEDRRGTSALSESLADVTRARRVSVWRLGHGGRSLSCEDCFDRETRIHTAGVELHHGELAPLWAALRAGEIVDVAEAGRDKRTATLAEAYLRPLGLQALMALPIQRGSEIIGSLWLEDLPPAAARVAGIESFARTAAHMEAARLAAAKPERTSAARPRREQQAADHSVPGTPAQRRETAIATDRQDMLRQHRLGEAVADDAADVFPSVTILTVFLADSAEPRQPASPADTHAAVAETTAADAVACALEDITQAHEIPYLKVLGNCIVAAAGFSGDPSHAARAIAGAALALRESELVAGRELRMGIDTGVALGGPVGRGRQCYNLWGTVTRRAAEMAQSAPLGGIQVTAFAYRHLTGDFLFRPRGSFYVHPEGETATYLLAGQI